MIAIDGAFGEGGGQIVRTAITLAAITQKDIEIINIRANRKNSGLAAQHLSAIKAVKRISSGKTEGLKLGSSKLKFFPKKLKGLEEEIDIGTAGSITLLLQCLIPVALFAEDKTKMKIKGGTDVRWSPPIDFYQNVFAKALHEMGCNTEIELKRRGYYPQGGGLVEATIFPLQHNLKGILSKEKEDKVLPMIGVSFSCNLPAYVAERQAKSAERILKERGYKAEIVRERDNEGEKKEKSIGSGITLWCGYKSGSALGERGKKAEDVGKEAARKILKELNSAPTVDIYLADQLILYMGLSKEKSEIKVREMTKHLETSIYVTKKLLDVEFEIEKEKNKGGEIVVIRKEKES